MRHELDPRKELLFYLHLARKEVAGSLPLSPELRDALIDGISRGGTSLQNRIQEDPFGTREKLKEAKGKLEKMGIIPSRPAISVYFVYNLFALALRTLAADALPRISGQHKITKDLALFAISFDASHGAQGVIGAVRMAEDRLRGADEDKIRESIDTVNMMEDVPLTWQTDVFLKARLAGQEFSQLLIKDPTGFELVDECVRRYENGNSSGAMPTLPCQIPEFVALGARIARDLYKAVYPLTEGLNS